ncbi:MAG: phosphopantetheine-binding protein [Gordonibacter sp.]|nr:phosphopantetheine-binding protein [Gordonibacter sp.]
MFDRVSTIIRDYVQQDDLVITPETDVLSDLGINSLELVELVCAFEMEFDMDIPEKDIRQFMTVQDIVQYLEASEA